MDTSTYEIQSRAADRRSENFQTRAYIGTLPLAMNYVAEWAKFLQPGDEVKIVFRNEVVLLMSVPYE